MPVLLDFAPIDSHEVTVYQFDGEIPPTLVEDYGLYDDAKYQSLENVWDVDAQHYVIMRDTFDDAVNVAIERFQQELHGRYEDGLNWDDDIKGMSWEEYWDSFKPCLQILDEVHLIKL